MGKKALYNKVNKVELKESLAAEPFDRITASFYRYVKIDEPELLNSKNSDFTSLRTSSGRTAGPAQKFHFLII